jgi:hypothetical protein
MRKFGARSSRWPVSRHVIVVAGLLSLLSIPSGVRAQDVSSDAPDAPLATAEPDNRSRRPTHLYFGMWTLHLRRDVLGLDNNWAVGVTWHGFFGATFMNSFGRRAFTGGLQRTIVSTRPAPLAASVGYRLGVVTGYDGRFMPLARKTPVLPLVQPFVSIGVTHISVEVSYTFVVISTAVSYRF